MHPSGPCIVHPRGMASSCSRTGSMTVARTWPWSGPPWGGIATPALFKPLTGLVRALCYEWDAARGQFLLKGTAPRPDDVEFLFMETGEKVE